MTAEGLVTAFLIGVAVCVLFSAPQPRPGGHRPKCREHGRRMCTLDGHAPPPAAPPRVPPSTPPK